MHAQLLRHIAEAEADAAELELAGCFGLAWVRRRDGRRLRSFALQLAAVGLADYERAAPPAPGKDDAP